eukprot:TRINITY_DN24377_c0_g2_i1.p1 TRINITY_DN24377_c0_g2~~TRINITY_DN24377_c0_g2_i1.p1  ORF type:complete len:539 (+),score=77.92 TRINITY_DN24377_c0_g2_i1:77-1693(+)
MKSVVFLAVAFGVFGFLAFNRLDSIAGEGLSGKSQPEGTLRSLKAKPKHGGQADDIDNDDDPHDKPDDNRRKADFIGIDNDDDPDDKGADQSSHGKLRSSHHSNGSQAIYDDRGWHLTGEDFVSEVMHPERLQPFYIQPVFFAIKLTFNMVVFGFSLRFKAKGEENCFIDSVQCVGRTCAGLFFILLALNGYFCDFRLFMDYTKGGIGMGKSIGIFLIIWATSGNYVACRAVWQSLEIENPVNLLGMTPNYAALPRVHIPLCPGGAKWLDPLKHIYALVLFPYFLPYYAVNLCQGIAMLIWCCSTKCVVCCNTILGSCNFSCALVGTILTLGLVAWPKSTLGYWWGLERPIYYQVFIQAWTSFVAPSIFAVMYGILICASRENIFKGMTAGFAAIVTMSNGFTVTKLLEDPDVEVLKKYNRDRLTEFQDYDRIPVDDPNKPTPSPTERVELEDSKIQIFLMTLNSMSTIVFEQLLTIFLVRALNGPADYNAYMGALEITITERTWASYTSYLRSLAQEEAMNAHNYLTKAAQALNLLV